MSYLRILVCTSEYPPDYSSGIGNVAYNIVEQLKKMDIDCTVCSPKANIKLGSSQVIEKSGILGLLYYWYRFSKYFKEQENDFDAVWLHNPLFLKNNPIQRSLVTIHTTYYGKMIRGVKPKIYYKIASKIERYCLNKIEDKARFTVVDTNIRGELEEIGINRQRITYIQNGVNTERFKPLDNKKMLRKKFGIPEDGVIILSLGRLSEQKQPQKMIEVFSVIEKELKDVTLAIAGKGELLEKTKEFARQKELMNVTFLGYIDEKDKPDLYACSDYYIMTSNYEGQPLTLLEAMASGLPCIVSDIPNLRLVEDANCGIIVDFTDVRKATKTIIKYLKGDNSGHSRNAREYAVNNLDWEIIAKKYFNQFKNFLKGVKGD